MKTVTKKWTKEAIRDLVNTSERAVHRGILAIYSRQTQDEKATEATRHHNNMGFNGADAKRGSYYARWISSGRQLTGNHLVRASRMLQKYCGQLATIANEKA